MKRIPSLLFPFLIGIVGLGAEPALAQQPPPPAPAFSQADLDQLLAPVALYPDPLLSQVLMAATYPLEVVQAARFVQANPGLSGDALAQSVASQPWDASVKSLAQFPTVLAMMNDRLDWMERLGDAFLAQQGAVMDTVQSLRARAQAAGTLTNTPQQVVQLDNGAIDIDPVAPDVIYVPYYDPTYAYGRWWWPEYPPMVWAPPAYYGYMPNYGIGFSAGFNIGLAGALFVYSRPNWGGHSFVTYSSPPHANPPGQNRPGRPNWSWPHNGGTVWAHNPEHRMGVAYRDPATQARFQAQSRSPAMQPGQPSRSAQQPQWQAPQQSEQRQMAVPQRNEQRTEPREYELPQRQSMPSAPPAVMRPQPAPEPMRQYAPPEPQREQRGAERESRENKEQPQERGRDKDREQNQR